MSGQVKTEIAAAIVNAYRNNKQPILIYDATSVKVIIPIYFMTPINLLDYGALWSGNAIAIQQNLGSSEYIIPDKMFYIMGTNNQVVLTNIYTLN